jgi:hypothetical protein
MRNIQMNMTFSVHPTLPGLWVITNGEGESGPRNNTCLIKEGLVARSGKAYWTTKSINGNVKIIVLSTGTFNFIDCTFTGQWQSSSGSSGSYAYFKLSQGKESPRKDLESQEDETEIEGSWTEQVEL